MEIDLTRFIELKSINIPQNVQKSEWGIILTGYVIPARVDGGWILQENSSAVAAAVAHKGIGVRDYIGFLDYFGIFFDILMDISPPMGWGGGGGGGEPIGGDEIHLFLIKIH